MDRGVAPVTGGVLRATRHYVGLLESRVNHRGSSRSTCVIFEKPAQAGYRADVMDSSVPRRRSSWSRPWTMMVPAPPPAPFAAPTPIAGPDHHP